ncbi:GNAT family N-acetyltransferase [Nocardioides sp. KR10-350]|uniref:GNAT family N-acetyltransferase n=1 Tax=Nocardioides cheoyonin TaxID=3156615 RepID=UPI0032B40DBE
MSPDTAAAAFGRWLWIPDFAQTVETEEYLLVRFPDYFIHPLELARLRPRGRATGQVLDEALARARELGPPSLNAWVRLDAPAGLDEALRARGGEPEETLDAFALDLSAGVPDLEPPELELRWFVDLATVRDGQRVEVEVFGGTMPPEERLARIVEEESEAYAAGRGGRVVAYLDGEPVGTGGLVVAGSDARLWGGAVVESARGRGVYRAVLAARLAYAADHGATIGLVKGRVETSGPILRRAGFEVFGQERSYVVPLGQAR